ncbi:oligosaccharide flippase family protein [Fictibacillus barbaricus]|uniref:O-antigen/teichoic acid export membrane protein n=1 Tax=Fictibacillus barbaricus TaxID=182136 RepID=A0ABU1TYU0_9BACL|nr:oligosaccharide flippase family protein [Fictibacillus barbaricus]MDR7072369.1 O-antigen/teichoic acid export membrane protein [Fictibacillus barbaricus]
MKLFFRGVLLLAAAALIGESLELLVNIILAKQLGEHGLGHYMSIFPTVILIIIIASLELPISISKFIAEKEEKLHYSMLKHATALTVIITIAMVAIAIVVLPFISVFNSYHPLVRWLMVALIPMISFTSIAHGYFMGKQQMGKLALSNLFRKVAQLILLTGIYQLFSFDKETAILIALATFVGSEFIVLIYLFTSYWLQYGKMKSQANQMMSGRFVAKSLMAVTVPTTGLRLFHALTNAIQPFLIKYALSATGLSDVAATEQFGLLAGVAIAIGFFPAFIAHSLLVVLIPTVSEATAKKDIEKLKMLLRRVMWITAAYGLPVIIFFLLFSEHLTILFFHSSSAATYLELLWPSFLFTFFLIPLQAYLIGLGLINTAFIQSVWSTCISFSLMYFLGSRPSLGMHGIIIGMNAGSVLLMLLHYFSVCKAIGITTWLRPKNEFHY